MYGIVNQNLFAVQKTYLEIFSYPSVSNAIWKVQEHQAILFPGHSYYNFESILFKKQNKKKKEKIKTAFSWAVGLLKHWVPWMLMLSRKAISFV